MNPIAERDFLKAQILDLERLLCLTQDDFLMTPGLASRKREMERRLAELRMQPRTPQVILYFTGGPVRGSEGIDAQFASKVLDAVQDIATAEYLHRKHGALGARGRLPDAPEARLLLTALPRGSFGLELKQANGSDFVASQQLSDALQHMADLVSAAGESDATYETALGEAPPRVLPKLKAFFEALQQRGARLRLVTGDREISLDEQRVASGVERVRATESEEESISLHGTFRGALLDSSRFDFKLDEGEIISGRLGEEVTDAQARKMLAEIDQPAVANFRRTKLQPRGGAPRWSYELLSLLPDHQG
ncbi:hypothetical protein RM530_16380 [Algiphilus sp. W345]|uniref:Uncharacterized protein n=1 Tax=Banduia mediterranea TaxID=3075609 RepID=A0ABU2WM17_9GAMM|nr:hypothetical protein [Algiphilus sp. W345]MDT0498923.1 hypothetical protein [Algiphilus sp. W345]